MVLQDQSVIKSANAAVVVTGRNCIRDIGGPPKYRRLPCLHDAELLHAGLKGRRLDAKLSGYAVDATDAPTAPLRRTNDMDPFGLVQRAVHRLACVQLN